MSPNFLLGLEGIELIASEFWGFNLIILLPLFSLSYSFASEMSYVSKLRVPLYISPYVPDLLIYYRLRRSFPSLPSI